MRPAIRVFQYLVVCWCVGTAFGYAQETTETTETTEPDEVQAADAKPDGDEASKPDEAAEPEADADSKPDEDAKPNEDADSKPDEGAKPEEVVEVAADAQADDDAKAADNELADWDRLIYIPFQKLQNVFGNQEGSAILPYAEYLELIKAYSKQQAEHANSPDAVMTQSRFAGKVEKEVVRLQAEFRITVVRADGWAKLPLNFGDVAVGKISADDDANVLLRGIGSGQYELLLKSAGQHTVTLELLAAVKTSPEHRSFAIRTPPVGISELTLTIPEPDQSIQITPLQVLLPIEEGSDEAADADADDNEEATDDAGDDNQQTVIRASLGATDRFEVRWNPAAGSRPVMDLLTSVTNRTAVRLETGLIQTTTSLDYEVLRGELTEVTVYAPADARIIDVVSAAGRIRSWNAEAVGTTHQQLVIQLLTPVTDRFKVEIQAERTPADDTFALLGKSEDGTWHGVHAQNVVRESGQLIVTTDAALTAVVKSQSGLKRVGTNVVTRSTNNDAAQAWDFSGSTGSLVVQVRPVEPRLLVDQGTRIVFDDDELKLITRLTYTVERAGVFELQLTYPESLTIDTVRADGMSEFHVDKDAGKLTLSLTQKRLGKIDVDITAHQAFDASAQNAETQIPTITPVNVEREVGRIAVFAPQFLDVATVDEQVSGLFPAEAADNDSRVGRAVRVSSWKYTQRPFTLTVRTAPRPAQLAASVTTTVNVEPDVVRINSVIVFDVRNAGINTYRVQVPEAVAGDVRFRSLNSAHTIQQRDRSSEAEDGWITWTLVLQDEVTGRVQIAADWDVQLQSLTEGSADAADADGGDADAANAAQVLAVNPVRVLPPFAGEQADKRRVTLTQTRGEVRLLRHESLSIAATGDGETMEKIDIRELELLPQEGFQAFRYFAQPVSLSVSIRRHEIHSVVKTVVQRAAVELVTDRQRDAGYRCRYRITSSERQRIRMRLPAGSVLQAPMLNSRRTTFEAADDVATEDGWDDYDVNVSREGTSDDAFLLSFQFRCPIVGEDRFPYEGRGSQQVLRLPQIGTDSDGTVVQETRAAVWSPREIAFVGEPSNWNIIGRSTWNLWNPMVSPTAAREADSLDKWIGDTGGGSEFARQGNVLVFRALGSREQLQVVWWNRPFLVAVISLALLFVGFILRRTPWENRLTLTIIGCLAVAVWSLKDASETLQFVTAGAPGILAVAGIWLTGLFFGSSADSNGSGANGSGDDPPNAGPDGSSPSGAPPAGSVPQSTVPLTSVPLTTVPRTSDSKAQAAGESTPENSPIPAQSQTAAAPAAVSPSPGVTKLMNDLMGGK